MGDATTNIGAFHESLNLAALWKLPVVYVVVNNGFGMGTSVEAGSSVVGAARKGVRLRHPGRRGRRQRRADRARRRPRSRRTRPLRAHAHADEHQELPPQGPLGGRSGPLSLGRVPQGDSRRRIRWLSLAERLKQSGVMDDDALADIDEEVEREVDAAVEFADAEPRARSRTSCSSSATRPPSPTSRRRCPGRIHGHSHLPPGAARHARRRDAPRPVGRPARRGDRPLRRLVQDHGRAAERVRRRARHGHAHRRRGLRRRRDRRGDARPAAGGRDHDRQLQPAGAGSDRQPRGQDPLHVRRSGARADGAAHARRRRPAAGGHAFAELQRLVRVRPGAQGRVARPRRPTRAACSRRPSATTTRSIFLENLALYNTKGEVPGPRRGSACVERPRSRGVHRADRHRVGHEGRHRPDADRLLAHVGGRARSRAAARNRTRASRSR